MFFMQSGIASTGEIHSLAVTARFNLDDMETCFQIPVTHKAEEELEYISQVSGVITGL